LARAAARPDTNGRARLFSSRHCERSEAIQTAAKERLWIASLRSQ
jgi:hypothetical protein